MAAVPVHPRVRELREPASPSTDENRPILECPFFNGNTDLAKSGLYARRTRFWRVKRKARFMSGLPAATAQPVPNVDATVRRVKVKMNVLTEEQVADLVAKGVIQG